MTNEALIRKLDLVVSDLDDGGLLNPEQSANFVRDAIEASTLLPQVRTVEMNSPQRNIDKIGFGERIMRVATENTALPNEAPEPGTFDPTSVTHQASRAKPAFDQVVLTTTEFIADVPIPYGVIEDNIEGGSLNPGGDRPTGGLVDTVLQLIAQRAALDLEELALQGDTDPATNDDYLETFDGYLKLAGTSNVVDHDNATIDKTLFRDGLKTLPKKYERDQDQMRHFLSRNDLIDYRDALGDRQTPLGDAQVQGRSPVFGFGVPIESVHKIPQGKGMFTAPMNLIWGVQRRIMIEFERLPRQRQIVFVLTIRLAIQVEETEALVQYKNIATAS